MIQKEVPSQDNYIAGQTTVQEVQDTPTPIIEPATTLIDRHDLDCDSSGGEKIF